MEITRTRVVDPSTEELHSIDCSILVVDIDNSELLENISSSFYEGSSGLQLTNNLIMKEYIKILEQIRKLLPGLPSNIKINLNFVELVYPLEFWISLLCYVLYTNISLDNNFIISEQTGANRKEYIQQNQNYQKWKNDLLSVQQNGESYYPIIDEELTLKLTLMSIFQTQNLNDENIEYILEKFNSLEDLIKHLYE